jgi:hypothetical protein
MELTEKIDLFLIGKLSPEEMHAFQEMIDSDPALAEEVLYQKLANEAIVDSKLAELNIKIRSDLDKLDSGTTLNKWFIGCGIILTIVGGALLFKNSKNEVAPKLNDSIVNKDSVSINTTPLKKVFAIDSFNENKSTNTNIPWENKSNKYIIDTTTSDINKNDAIEVNNEKRNSVIPIEQKNTEPAKTVFNNPCLTMTLSMLPDIYESCYNNATGEIVFIPNTIQGGSAPYMYSLDNGISFQTNTTFSNLKGGSYYLTIKDSKNCTQSFTNELYVSTKHCNQNNSYSFSPINGEKWQHPLTNTTGGSIEIKNKLGQLVYSNHWASGVDHIEWDGNSQAGGALSIGEYLYIIHYSTSEIENGYVSIVK